MKKILAFVLILAMLFCAASAEAADVSGSWYADLFGMSMTLTLEDGAYTLDMAGEVEGGTYSFDGTTLYMDEDTEAEVQMPYDAESNKFILDMGDGMLVEFGREPIAAFVPAAARIDSTIEEFAGRWITDQVDAFGMIVPPEMLGFNLELTIEGSTVSMMIDLMGDITEAAIEGALADGVLTVNVPGDEYSEDLVITIQLLEDGTMASAFETYGEAVSFYMSIAPETV